MANGEAVPDTATGLGRNPANYVPLSPVGLLDYAAELYPRRAAVAYNGLTRSWAELRERSRRLAAALIAAGIGPGETVAVLAANTPEAFELHFGVPLARAVLNTINTRLDPASIAEILDHGQSRILLTDREFSRVAGPALRLLGRPILVVDIDDSGVEGGALLGSMDYEAFLATGEADLPWSGPADEWDTIALNYTSGTTGAAKGVVYSHRGAYLNAVSNVIYSGIGRRAVLLWTLPLFHCNGWCFAWSMAVVGGTSICLRHVRVETVLDSIARYRVTHLCGAPFVLRMLVNAPEALGNAAPAGLTFVVGGATPSAAMLEAGEQLGIDIVHGYGLTESYGAAVICADQEEWAALPAPERAQLKARQGARGLTLDALIVADPRSLEPVPRDGSSWGEILMRGNTLMKGYFREPEATGQTLQGGWFHTGDLAVWHPDGYVEIKDRSKDIINSGGEKISSLEVEAILCDHPAVLEAAIVAKPDPEWGETPCAFVTLKPDETVDERAIIAHCRRRLAHYKVPRTIVFGPLPKNATGKVKKAELRAQASRLSLLI